MIPTYWNNLAIIEDNFKVNIVIMCLHDYRYNFICTIIFILYYKLHSAKII